MTDSADIEASAAPARRGWGKVVAVVALSLALGLKVDCLICGLLGYPPWSFAIAVYPGIPLAVAGFVYLLIRAVVKLRRWKAAKFWNRLTTVSFLVALYVAPVVVPSMPHRLGFYLWAKRNVDVAPIAAWTETFDAPAGIGEAARGQECCEVPPEALPDAARRLVEQAWHEGRYVRANRRLGPQVEFSRATRRLVISYGSGMMGFWGITIGRGAAGSPECTGHALGEDAYVWSSQ